tara:strand:+ start:36391 stop:36612 length:222 start_codon:yes stop_codon:yes gene_type:complete
MDVFVTDEECILMANVAVLFEQYEGESDMEGEAFSEKKAFSETKAISEKKAISETKAFSDLDTENLYSMPVAA